MADESPRAGRKRCLVVADAVDGLHRCEVELAADATVAAALEVARVQLGAVAAAVDWDHAATGIWGRARPRDFCWSEGDRIELYRPLPADPRVRRRERSRYGARGGSATR